jgi:hypothetical protein
MEQNPFKPTPDEAKNFLARKTADVMLKLKKQDEARKGEEAGDFARFIDPHFDYSPTLEDFLQDVKAYHPTRRGNEYMRYLRESKKKYGNSAYYYCTWGGSPANEMRGDEHRKIVEFITTELKRDDIGETETRVSLPADYPEETDPYFGLVEHFKKLLDEAENKAEKGEGKNMKEWSEIRLAAFVEIMFEKQWFESEHRIKTCNAFASARYGANINNQLAATKKGDRKSHKTQLNKYFK